MTRSWLTTCAAVHRSALPDSTTMELVFGVKVTLRFVASIGCQVAPSFPVNVYCCVLCADVPRSTPILAILLALSSVNHILPSGPGAIPPGWAFAVGTRNSPIVPDILILPTLFILALYSLHHLLPSAPPP